MKNTLTATFEIVTPMFLGGADQATSSIRPASIKGALRFWWRALNWGRFAAQHPGSEYTALQAMHAEEARLFGIAAGDESGGQGVFMLQVVAGKGLTAVDQPFGRGFDAGILYLLGMGLGAFAGGNHTLRKALPAGGTFDVRMIFRPGTAAGDVEGISTALKLFGLLGALGSRARHGFGSVRMLEQRREGYVEKTAPDDETGYADLFAELLPQTANKRSLTPSIDQGGHIAVVARGSSVESLLQQIGREQQAYRSFGQNGKVNGKDAERNFWPDHDLIADFIKGKAPDMHPERVVFGLPHNYYFSSTNGQADVNYKPKLGEGRRASPLLLHIHKLSGNRFIAVHTLLKSQFLPFDAKIEIKSRGSRQQVAVDADWSVIEKYLARFTERKVIYG